MSNTRLHRQRGSSMVEVLVSIVIVVVGLLGLAGLQSQAALAEMEAYQRSQAVVLLNDMVDRINANRRNSMAYVTGSPLGTGNPSENCALLDGVARDQCEWNNALLGAAETAAGGAVGAMIGARGCVANISPIMPRQFLVSVAWQGVTPTAKPTASDCGENQYGDERTRRVVVANVVIGCLQNNPATGLCVTP